MIISVVIGILIAVYILCNLEVILGLIALPFVLAWKCIKWPVVYAVYGYLWLHKRYDAWAEFGLFVTAVGGLYLWVWLAGV